MKSYEIRVFQTDAHSTANQMAVSRTNRILTAASIRNPLTNFILDGQKYNTIKIGMSHYIHI